VQFNSWTKKEDWSKEICEFHKIDAKLYIANCLHEKFVDLGKAADTMEFKDYANNQILKTNIACQLLSLAFEMTEDLAATCFSYAKAIKQKTKNVPEYLRDFGDLQKKQKGDDVGTPSAFYEKVTKSIINVAEMTGLDPIRDVGATLAYYEIFKVIQRFREEYDDWYQGYKHGQRTLPIYMWPSNANATKENTKFVLYRIPQEIQEVTGQIFVETDVIQALENEEQFMRVIGTVTKLWAEVKQRQFPRVFT
jgi:hypothetical protein